MADTRVDTPTNFPPGKDVAPISPVSDTEDDRTSTQSQAVECPRLTSFQERRLSIRVPIEYVPPTPPPSASLPALPTPGRRQSLPPMQQAPRKRISLVPLDTPLPNGKHSDAAAPPPVVVAAAAIPSIATIPEVSISPSISNDSTNVASKVIFVSPSSSAIHLPTASKEPQGQEARYGAELLPVSPTPSTQPTHPRRQSTQPTHPRRQSTQPHTPQTPRKIRQSPSILDSPSHVSLIDFESSDEELDEDVALLSFQEHPRQFQGDSDDSDLSRWAPDPVAPPVYFPAKPVSHVPAPPPPSTQWPTRSLTSAMRSGHREGNTGGRRAGAKHLTLMGLSSMPTEMMLGDVDFTMRSLMNREMFAKMLRDPLARQRFREFLAVEGTTAELDFWTDTYFFEHSLEQLRVNGSAFRDLYMSNASDAHVPISPENRRELLAVFQRVLVVDSSFGNTQAQLLESMYNNQFHRFVKHKIIQEAHVTLGKANLVAQDSEGLGDTFVLTNPRLPDHPIVLVSDGFVDMTGYPKAQIIGRNCRFLQGPGTPPASVQRIRDGLNSGKGGTELLLNYRRNGEPFFCLLCIIPVRDASGAIVYFIGGQTNVTSLLATEKGFGFLGASSACGDGQPIQMSPALALFCEQLPGGGGTMGPVVSDLGLRARGAAGAVTNGVGRGANLNGVGGGGGGGGGGFFRGLFGGAASAGSGGVPRLDGKTVIAGAEAMMGVPGARGLQDQYALFQHTYNKLLIFKQKKREITFVTPQMLATHLAYLNLPTRTQRELLASPLIRNDIVALLTAGEDRNETRRLRAEVKDAVRRGTTCSVHCGVKVPGKNILARTDYTKHRFGMMHMTPIKDSDGVAVAFVAIFG
ncbi:hypothetical protein B0H10DRAFT_376288 [Mycena sp. CBHHK59/15]|nr:hypothetical protein B0H10DRAFT_376288 [Mycena sp. CBHHK59/15]